MRAATLLDGRHLMLKATEPLELNGERVIPKIIWQRIDRSSV